VILVILALWWVPKIQVASLRNAKNVTAKDVFKAENDARATWAQILGGFAVLVGLWFAWKNITATKEGQVTERFYKAIEQLGATDEKGNPKLALRLGGIYALERIARDSEKDHWPIMEVLTAYVRENAKLKEHPLASCSKGATNRLSEEYSDERGEQLSFREIETLIANPLATDIAAIVTVIRRREWSYEKRDQKLDLHGANLHGANLHEVHLEGANLFLAHLELAYLEHAHLRGANLNDAHLKGANLIHADLKGATLVLTHLEGAFLEDAHLEGAALAKPYLESTGLHSAHLKGATGLTQRQVDSANGNARTELPPGIVMPESWKNT
jgi:uncharacterized protein YjbI with pentapeptide repeats